MEIKISKSNFIPVESDVIFNPVKDMVSILLCMVYVLSDLGVKSWFMPGLPSIYI